MRWINGSADTIQLRVNHGRKNDSHEYAESAEKGFGYSPAIAEPAAVVIEIGVGTFFLERSRTHTELK